MITWTITTQYLSLRPPFKNVEAPARILPQDSQRATTTERTPQHWAREPLSRLTWPCRGQRQRYVQNEAFWEGMCEFIFSCVEERLC